MLQVTLRPRVAYLYRLLSEVGLEVFNLLLAISQLAACPGFLPSAAKDYYVTACWIFFCSSVTSTALMLHAAIDSYHHIHHLLPALRQERGNAELEFEESVLYTLSSLMFAAGSILFLPEVYETDERTYLTAGTWLFFFGSLLLWLASFLNSLNVYEVGPWSLQHPSVKVGTISLMITQFGSICYAVGSVGYFPQLASDTPTEWNIVAFGTIFYVVGASAYVLSAFLTVVVALIKHSDAVKVAAHKRNLVAHGAAIALLFASRPRLHKSLRTDGSTVALAAD
uniref:YrhK domain-containing protein n=1 Tax=Chromera velia CCMP2878 TaxID=1169474 RepID=A0A0G4F591_9ALVE|eukprot:Cvel_15099.t1-p1 / transcript=Cvel_15099.t1 / gene=Cvel_15099 / organism=Chromera_velia_CCMP2878 / gene_product=hypothetical protein / transcript_product=hypothetical protein / location=Cvel_scaffold1102:4659-5501(+) / protein_length=281 / sequence_SO=supercontig / SO=protein_coding / is_pseudo=false